MFKEIVSQLSFSPVMVERLSVYARTVRSQQRISGWSLFVLTILVIMQAIITVAPPQSLIDTPDHITHNLTSDDFQSPLMDDTPTTNNKTWQQLLYDIPTLDDGLLIFVYGILLVINAATYCTLRQRSREIRIIRTQLNTGTV